MTWISASSYSWSRRNFIMMMNRIWSYTNGLMSLACTSSTNLSEEQHYSRYTQRVLYTFSLLSEEKNHEIIIKEFSDSIMIWIILKSFMRLFCLKILSSLNQAQLKYKTILKAEFSREWKVSVILSVKSLFNSLQTWSHVYCTAVLAHYFLISLITQHKIEFISLRLRDFCQIKDHRLIW